MRIVTHNGKIHGDEVASVALLTAYFTYQGEEVFVFRSRDETQYLETDILVDVGLVYDHDNLKYDHHQSNFNQRWSLEDTIPLSSAGLIWRHYGCEIIEMYLNESSDSNIESQNSFTEETITDLQNIIYHRLIQEIDANDNGIDFKTSELNLSDLVSTLNGDVANDVTQNENFNRAVGLIGNIFDIKFGEIINSYFNLQTDLDKMRRMDLSGPCLLIEENIPTIFQCLTELDPEEKVKFCIFESNREFTIKTRGKDGNKFRPICPILPQVVLQHSCPPDELIFVHQNGFLAKSKTLDTAKLIVQLSLEELTSVESFEEETINLEILKDKRIWSLAAIGSIGILGIVYWKFID